MIEVKEIVKGDGSGKVSLKVDTVDETYFFYDIVEYFEEEYHKDEFFFSVRYYTEIEKIESEVISRIPIQDIEEVVKIYEDGTSKLKKMKTRAQDTMVDLKFFAQFLHCLKTADTDDIELLEDFLVDWSNGKLYLD